MANKIMHHMIHGDDAYEIVDKKLRDAFVTPEMFGAVGDGVTDDSDAIQLASRNGIIDASGKTYFIGKSCTLVNDVIGGKFIVKNNSSISVQNDNVTLSGCEIVNDDYYPSTGRGYWVVVLTEADNLRVENCYFHKGVSCLYINRCTNVIVTNNVFEDFRQIVPDGGGNGYGVLLVESKNILINDNIFLNVARHSVYISQDGSSSYNEDIVINNNVFKWDDNVVGNTGGFELTINVRPSKRVTISNNKFINMFAVAGFVIQNILVNGVTTPASSEDINIVNNYGVFKNHPRPNDTGIIFLPSSEETFPAVKNVVIKNNLFTIEKGSFVVANAFDGISIEGNEIKYTSAATNILVYVAYSSASIPCRNLSLVNNAIENAGSIFSFNGDSSTPPKNFGRVVLYNNKLDIGYLGGLPSNGSSFDDLEIVGNIIKSNEARAYFSSATVTRLTLKSNTVNKRVVLYLNATNVLSTDPSFSGYGYNTSNPSNSGIIPGSIHIWNDGSTYIADVTGAWKKVQFETASS